MSASEVDERQRRNVEKQISRLLQQLSDVKKNDDEGGFLSTLPPELGLTMRESERERVEKETRKQLEKFGEVINIASASTRLENARWATRVAIKDAFQTPEILLMFARRDVEMLRERMQTVEQEERLGKIKKKKGVNERTEILVALKKLGANLSEREARFLKDNLNEERAKEFEQLRRG